MNIQTDTVIYNYIYNYIYSYIIIVCNIYIIILYSNII